jgi:hypothetical protein
MNILCLRLFVNIFNFFLKKQKTKDKFEKHYKRTY